jgi:hypothetical protein
MNMVVAQKKRSCFVKVNLYFIASFGIRSGVRGISALFHSKLPSNLCVVVTENVKVRSVNIAQH